MSELTASDSCPSAAATYSTEAPPAGDSSISSCLPASNSNLLGHPVTIFHLTISSPS